MLTLNGLYKLASEVTQDAFGSTRQGEGVVGYEYKCGGGYGHGLNTTEVSNNDRQIQLTIQFRTEK